ncbi:serine acetyltransferase [Actinomyces ruminis]|uniref:serine acetyltransferase n=1 Tax=Actinomyces ruminis TaxID=1937003 RepID=UPI0011777019|nr:serine acetyltransferase [Actinomyces ruminis]
MDPVYAAYSAARWCARHGLCSAARLARGEKRVVFACDVSRAAKIGKGTVCPHRTLGVVIHPAAEIGENCRAGQNVAIGGHMGIDALPRLGDRAAVGGDALILKDGRGDS